MRLWILKWPTIFLRKKLHLLRRSKIYIEYFVPIQTDQVFLEALEKCEFKAHL